MKTNRLAVLLIVATLASAAPCAATFHIMVVDQVFPGLVEAPAAQYVTLRMEAPLQIAVYGQPTTAEDASGTASTFAAFCGTVPHSACSLPTVSPACRTPGCPNALQSQDSRILIATPFAQGLFCVTADLLATGTISSPDGRVCFGDCSLRMDCGDGPVDCVAYGNFTGDNGSFGQPAAALPLGSALIGRSDRTNQFIGGAFLDSASGFSIGDPAPKNFHGDLGSFTGMSGDADGNASVDGADVDAEFSATFAGGSRCDLEAPQRGADANLDTRVNAADVVEVVRLVTTRS